MDSLLTDIKNFLKKLESGQLDIEAGQWELHKDIANMKKSVEELKKLKEDVEVMRIDNAEQKELIKNLEAKLEMFGSHLKNDEPVTVSESSVEYETVYRMPPGEQMPPKGYKKRKCHRVRSEEIIEITSNISDKKSTSSDHEEPAQRHEESPTGKVAKNDQPSDDNSNPTQTHVDIVPMQDNPKLRFQSHTGNGILQRYLKDSVKYRERKASCSSDVTGTASQPSDSVISKNESECSNFWDEYGSRALQSHTYRVPSGVKRKVSSDSTKSAESIIPKRLICPKTPKKFTFKSDFPEGEPPKRVSRRVRHFYRCKVCRKEFGDRNLLMLHKASHKSSARNQRKRKEGFKCSYCDKVCSTPEKLTLHLKNCRIIMKSHYKRR